MDPQQIVPSPAAMAERGSMGGDVGRDEGGAGCGGGGGRGAGGCYGTQDASARDPSCSAVAGDGPLEKAGPANEGGAAPAVGEEEKLESAAPGSSAEAPPSLLPRKEGDRDAASAADVQGVAPFSSPAPADCEQKGFDARHGNDPKGDGDAIASGVRVRDVSVQCSLLLEANSDQSQADGGAGNHRSLRVDRELSSCLVSELKKTVRALKNMQKLKSVHNDSDITPSTHICLDLPDGLQATVSYLSEQVSGLRQALDQLAKKIIEVGFECGDLKAAKGAFRADFQDNTGVNKQLSMEQHSHIKPLIATIEQVELPHGGTTPAMCGIKDTYQNGHPLNCKEPDGCSFPRNKKMRREEFSWVEKHQNRRDRKLEDGKVEDENHDVGRMVSKFADRRHGRKLPILKKVGRHNFIVGRA